MNEAALADLPAEIAPSPADRAGEVLTPAALDFVAELHRRFE